MSDPGTPGIGSQLSSFINLLNDGALTFHTKFYNNSKTRPVRRQMDFLTCHKPVNVNVLCPFWTKSCCNFSHSLRKLFLILLMMQRNVLACCDYRMKVLKPKYSKTGTCFENK